MVEKSTARADEAGDKSEEFSDAKKMDKLMDMVGDACSKMDAVGARMDAFEERQSKADARLDAWDEEKKDSAKKDEDEKEEEKKADAEKEPEEKGEPKEPAADKKDEAEDKKEEDKKDASEKEDEPKADAVAREGITAMRAEIDAMQARLPKAITDAERGEFAAIQARADVAYQAFGDHAGRPLDGETPMQYDRRLIAGLQKHSPTWEKTRISSIADQAALDVIGAQVYADSIAAARRGSGTQPGAMREVRRESGTGHTIIEFEGDSPMSWMYQFAGAHHRSTGNFAKP